MKRSIKTLAITAVTVAATTLQTIPTEACGSRGRGGISVSRGPAYQHIRNRRYVQPHYVPPQPVCTQPVYTQPVYGGQPGPGIGPQPVAPPQPGMPPQSGLPPQSGMPPQPGIQQPGTQPNQGIGAPQQQPRSVAQANQQPVQSNNAPSAAAPATPANNTSEQSALQMLASLSGDDTTASDNSTQIPEFTPASGNLNTHSGTWKVNLPGNQAVQLELNDDGSFSWTATRNGKSSSFQGQFRLENDRLTLVRSNDLQQMTGTWSGQGSNFTFKLDGATTSGLAFVRS